MNKTWAGRLGAVFLWCALPFGAAPAIAAEVASEADIPPVPGLTLGRAIGGDKTANTRWQSNGAARYFIDLLRAKLGGGRNRLDIEMIALNSGSPDVSQIRYIVTAPEGGIVFDETMRTATPSPAFVDDGKGNLRQSLANFAKAYAEVQAGGVRKSAQSAVPAAGTGYLGMRPMRFGSLGLSSSGVTALSVEPDGPAAKAGIQQGDLLITAAGEKLSGAKSLTEIVSVIAPGTSMPIELKRGDQMMTINVIIGARPAEKDIKVEGKPAAIAEWSATRTESGYPIMEISPTGWIQTGPDMVSQCYRFNTTKNSQWNLQVWPVAKQPGLMLEIVVGDECSTAHFVAGSKLTRGGGYYLSYGNFVAGGGPYLARISMPLKWLGQPVSFGTIKLSLKREQDNIVGAAPTIEQVRTAAVTQLESSEDGRASASMIAPTAPARARGAAIQDCELCPAMVVLPAGSFTMGSTSAEMDRKPNEGPTRTVRIANAFAMGKYEVTFDEWDACVADGGCARVTDNGWGRGKRPVVNTTWLDARRYVEWLSKKTGKRYFLPSEAEWEYAARARTSTPWNTGDAVLTDDANILDSYKQTVPVGGFPPNAFGLYDMHGNASEWTLDCVDVGYFGVGSDGAPNITPGCPMRAVRGGSFHNEPADVRSARRMAVAAETKSTSSGFRVARAL